MVRLPHQRNGVTLLIVIFTIAVVGGLLTFVAANGAYFYKTSQIDRVRSVSRAVNDSALAYARMNLDIWKSAPPTEPINLKVDELLLPNMTGSATIGFLEENQHLICRVSSRVTRASVSVARQVDIGIDRNDVMQTNTQTSQPR